MSKSVNLEAILAETKSVFAVGNSYSVMFSNETKRIRYREEQDMSPMIIDGKPVIKWGMDNNLPYDILEKIEQDETVSSCQTFNSEILYGGGIEFDDELCSEAAKKQIREFFEENAVSSSWLGMCQDMKHYAFAVVVLMMNGDNSKIVSIERKEACNVRFEKANEEGKIENIYYANWRNTNNPPHRIYPLLDVNRPLADLREKAARHKNVHNYAMLVRIPSVDMMYYPIPYYGSIFTSRWYNIKRCIATAKEAKITNSAPLKYQIEVSPNYWKKLIEESALTDKKEIKKLINSKKKEFIDYLTGAQNSGKVLFSGLTVWPDGKEEHDVIIKPIETGKQGGDWEQDLSEAVNIICFSMGVHSNLVGSVPGKTQTNNSGSDKRELYTIAQLRQRPYHDLMFSPFRLIAAYNKWEGAKPKCPLLMLTTLDEHTDVKPLTNE